MNRTNLSLYMTTCTEVGEVCMAVAVLPYSGMNTSSGNYNTHKHMNVVNVTMTTRLHEITHK